MAPSDEILVEHNVLVGSDNEFQRRARLFQALWRERQALPVGTHRGRPLGSRLAMPFAEETLANYMTETIREVFRAEVMHPIKSQGKLYRQPRIFEDLLASQPLCFNLFAELQNDHDLASTTFQHLLGEQGVRVTAIEFEHSPGRGDSRFTGDHSAFDVFVVYDTASGGRAFVGIEVKYVEDLDVPVACHRSRYDEVADAMGVFSPDARHRVRQPPLEQFWRDHLLAGSLALDQGSRFQRGSFAVIYPTNNTIVRAGVEAYRSCLSERSTFLPWTLESALDAMQAGGAGDWVREVRERYLGA